MKTIPIALWLVPAALLVASGYDGLLLIRQANALATERSRAAKLAHDLSAVRAQTEAANRALADAEEQLAAAETSEAAGATEYRAALRSWHAHTAKLKQTFNERPDQWIPELKFLSELDWFSLAHQLALESESDRRRAWAAARDAAVTKFLPTLRRALNAYVTSTGGVLPSDVSQLLPFFRTPIDPSLLARYEMTGSGDASKHETGHVDTIAERAPIDEDYDWRHTIRTNGQYSGPWDGVVMRQTLLRAAKDFQAANDGKASKDDFELLPFIADPAWRGIVQASAQYQKDHGGQRPTGSAELRPYVQDPTARTKLEKMIRQEKNSPNWHPNA